MKTILIIIQKEFIQIKRDKTMLPIIFVVPIIQLLFLVYAATFDIKNIDLVIVDNDLSTSSRKISQKFIASPFFNVKNTTFSVKEAQNDIKKGKADIAIIIPYRFEHNLIKNKKGNIQILADAINQTTAAIGNSYCQRIIYDFNKQIILETAEPETLK
ncbi:MAG: ABC transporter permease, partial [Bacteroidota bacterium]|nr:ABC transporter permease [Bacteroidota bacterium]